MTQLSIFSAVREPLSRRISLAAERLRAALRDAADPQIGAALQAAARRSAGR